MNIRISFVPFAGSLLALSLLTACSDGGHDNDDAPTQQQEHKLRKVGSASELEAYLKNGLKAAAEGNGYISVSQPVSMPSMPVASPSVDADAGNNSPDPAASFSNTTLIEEGVDEPDIIKSDGDLVYITMPSNNGCYELCAVAEPTAANSADIAVGEPYPGSTQNRIRVMRMDDATHSSTEITHIDIPHSAQYDYQYTTGVMFTNASNAKELVAITNASGNIYQNANPTEPESWSSIWSWSFGRTVIDTFDISNTSSITHQHRIELDGYLLQTRRIDNTLYVVTRFTPEVTITGTIETKKAEIDALSLTQLLPKVSVDGNETTQVSPDNCFVDAVASGYPTLMVVTAIDLDDNSLKSSCVTANLYGFYMSKAALYLTQSEWSESDSYSTNIYKFALSEDGPIYRGEGGVEGMPVANENFAISEHDDVLRIATTTRDAAWIPTNHLHTLSETANGDLQTLATLPNAQHPESIGKPGETIQGIRFVGDRAYVVTYLRRDPLYVVDLSDPANPFIAGQVEIPGFSTLLQPLSSDLLLGIGLEDGRDLKVELYDVADPSAPQSIDKYVMSVFPDNGYSYSSAEWDHHALALMPIHDGVKVALPFSRYNYASYSAIRGAISFSVDVLNRGMSEVVQTDATGDELVYGEQRVLLQSNSLHYIQNSKIWSSPWGSSELLANPK